MNASGIIARIIVRVVVLACVVLGPYALAPASPDASSSTQYERVAVSGPFQGDCGRFTCTVRFDRAQTKNMRDAGAVVGVAAAACGVVSAGVLAGVCGLAVAPAAGVISIAANRFYDEGKCIKLKIVKTPNAPVAIPMALKRGTYNCR